MQKKTCFIEKLKSVNFLEFSSNLFSFLISWNSHYSEKQFWLLKWLKLLRSFIVYDTFHFLEFIEKEIGKNLFLPMFSNLFVFYGLETQIEVKYKNYQNFISFGLFFVKVNSFLDRRNLEIDSRRYRFLKIL